MNKVFQPKTNNNNFSKEKMPENFLNKTVKEIAVLEPNVFISWVNNIIERELYKHTTSFDSHRIDDLKQSVCLNLIQANPCFGSGGKATNYIKICTKHRIFEIKRQMHPFKIPISLKNHSPQTTNDFGAIHNQTLEELYEQQHESQEDREEKFSSIHKGTMTKSNYPLRHWQESKINYVDTFFEYYYSIFPDDKKNSQNNQPHQPDFFPHSSSSTD